MPCTLRYSKWVPPYRYEIFFLIYLIFFSSSVLSEPFYRHFAKSQKIDHQQLRADANSKLSGFYSANLITSSTPSIKFYADILAEKGLPIDLAVIPLMESGNNPQAKSPMGALGLWQFIPSTAREWGLSSTRSDDRKNVIKSTQIAINYLSYLHNQLNDWDLALAAYNWGIGNVKKAIRKGLVKNNTINLKLLPRETRNYLIAFHHLNRLIKFGYKSEDFRKFPNRPYLTIIKQSNIDNYLNKNDLLDIDPKVLLHINGYDVKRRNSLNPDVLVPTQTFIKFFSTNKVSFKQPKKKKGCSNRYYKVRRGDSISKVARKFKIKIDTFNKMNPSIAHLRPGFLVKVCP